MNKKVQIPKIFETLIPFIIAGIAIALFIGILFMFSYVVIWGLFIGGILWLVSVVKGLVFPNTEKKSVSPKKNEGRIIEHDDKK